MKVLDQQTEKKISSNMDDVIATTKKVRDTLLDENITLKEKEAQLEVFKLIISANKGIVTASITELTAKKLANTEVNGK